MFDQKFSFQFAKSGAGPLRFLVILTTKVQRHASFFGKAPQKHEF